MKKMLTMLLCLCLLASLPCASVFAEEAQSTAAALVVYFSATGHTKPLAEYAAAHLNADLYEIVAAQPYTTADLNYNDSSSRSTLEMSDDTARPEIENPLESIDRYDVIFLGYPIWWGEAPRIVSTFLESFDFSGKTIVPFCTSASSGVGQSAERLRALCGEETAWLDGTRFAIGTEEAAITAWIDSLALTTSKKQ